MEQKSDVLQLLREKQQLIACIEELELEASRNYRALTEELRALKMAHKELQGKYEFSESHYQMTLRHANNLQSFLDARDQELAHLRSREQELAHLRSREQELQEEVNARKGELARNCNYMEELTNLQEQQQEELFRLRQQLDRTYQTLQLREDELSQTQRHADNLQKMSEVWTDELMKARRHADNLQQMLDAIEQQGRLRGKLHRLKERVQRWFR